MENFEDVISQVQDPDDVVGVDIYLLMELEPLYDPRVVVYFPEFYPEESSLIKDALREKHYGLVGQRRMGEKLVEIYVKDYLPLSYYEGRFEDPMFCRNDIYCLRNEALVTLLDEPPRKVFEFAGGSGLLAEVLLRVYPTTQLYHHSDLSPLACKQAFKKMSEVSAETVTTVYSEPIDIIWNRPDLKKYDLVTTTSMEHLPKGTDLRIIEELSPGTTVLFSLTSFGKPGHPHPFPTKEYIISRYGGLIDVEKLIFYENLSVWLLKGIIR